MITPLAEQQPWLPNTTSKDQAPAYRAGQGEQSQATSILTAKAPCVKKMTRLLAKLKPLTTVSALLSLVSKVWNYATTSLSLSLPLSLSVCACHTEEKVSGTATDV